MQQSRLHLDLVGTLEHVLAGLQRRTPEIFENVTQEFIDAVREMIVQQANVNQWTLVAVVLTQGLARQVLDDMLENPVPRTGPLVIDPAGNIPEYHLYNSESQLRSARDRLVGVNEAMSDIMVIIYGVEEQNRDWMLNCAARRMRTLGLTLDLMDGDDIPKETADDRITWRVSAGRERLIEARRFCGMLLEYLPEEEAKNYVDATGNLIRPKANAVLHALALAAWGLAQLADDTAQQKTLKSVYNAVRRMPDDFKGLGLSKPPKIELQALAVEAPTLQQKAQDNVQQKTQVANSGVVLENKPSLSLGAKAPSAETLVQQERPVAKPVLDPS